MKKPTIAELIQRYASLYDDEKAFFTEAFEQAKNAKNDFEITNRKNFIGHFTASAFIINPVDKRVLLLDHKALKRKLTPGGHIEKGETPLEAALRELEEETGLKSNQVERWSPNLSNEDTPFYISSHPIPKNDKKQEDEHYHHNFEYIFFIKPNFEIILDTAESDGYEWIDFDMAIDILDRPEAKYNKLLEEK